MWQFFLKRVLNDYTFGWQEAPPHSDFEWLDISTYYDNICPQGSFFQMLYFSSLVVSLYNTHLRVGGGGKKGNIIPIREYAYNIFFYFCQDK